MNEINMIIKRRCNVEKEECKAFFTFDRSTEFQYKITRGNIQRDFSSPFFLLSFIFTIDIPLVDIFYVVQ